MTGPTDEALRWLADLAVRGAYVSREDLLQREILNEESVPFVLGVDPPTKWIEMCDENGANSRTMRPWEAREVRVVSNQGREAARG